MNEYQDEIEVFTFQKLIYDIWKLDEFCRNDGLSLERKKSIYEEFKSLPELIEGYPPKSDITNFCFHCLKKYFLDVDPLSIPLSMISLYSEEQIEINYFMNDYGFLAITGFIKSQQETEVIIREVKIEEEKIKELDGFPTKRRRI
ncbi:hypothetical protein ACVV7K_003827 [Cronobacter sakazakii]